MAGQRESPLGAALSSRLVMQPVRPCCLPSFVSRCSHELVEQIACNSRVTVAGSGYCGGNGWKSILSLQSALSPPAYAEHLARSPFIQFPCFCILKPDAFVSRDVESQVMILEILVVASFRHMQVDSALSQTSTNVEVHPHVCRSNLVSFGF
jgi:hypothetical protein